jgi:hypothetical protein
LIGACIGKDQGNFILNEWNQLFELRNLTTMLCLKVFKIFISDSFNSHLNNLFDKSIFGDDEDARLFSENLSDLLNLARTDISEASEDYLFVLSKKGI